MNALQKGIRTYLCEQLQRVIDAIGAGVFF